MIDCMEKKVETNWYQKAEDVVMSSKTLGQLQVARNYIEHYKKQTNDVSGYDVLIRKYVSKISELSYE